MKRHSGGRAEESLAVSRDGASVDNSPCVRRSSSYEDGGNDPEGELPVETRHLSGLRKKQEELYLLPDLEETERRRCENETRQACADDDDWSQPGMEEAALDEAVVLRSQSHSLIVAENQAGREIVEARKVLGVVEHGAPRRHDDDIQQEKSEPGRRVGSEGGKRERTSLETEEDLGKAEGEKSRKRKNMKSKHQKHSPDACDDKLVRMLLLFSTVPCSRVTVVRHTVDSCSRLTCSYTGLWRVWPYAGSNHVEDPVSLCVCRARVSLPLPHGIHMPERVARNSS